MRDSSGHESQSPTRLKVTICGGGLAGFATALLLREDHDVTVLEQSQSNEETGAAITLSMNASRLLQSSLKRAGFDKDKSRYIEAEKLQEVHWQTLELVHEIPIHYATAHYKAPWWYFSRKDLHQELKRAALAADGPGQASHLILGAEVERVDLAAQTVYLRNGDSHRSEVIIAADGIRTASGRSVFGKMPTVFHGVSAYRCMIPREQMKQDPDIAPLVDSAKVLMIVGPNKRIVAYPCSNWEMMNFVCIFPDATDRKLQWTSKISVQEMLEDFKDFHPAVVKALSMATETGLWQLRDRDPLETLVKDCLALVGDAAHAMGPYQGQGACQAVEDAEALRVALKGARPEDVAERLRVYDKLRVPRVAKAVQITRDMAPKNKGAQDVDLATQEGYRDFFWSYMLTQEAVKMMNDAGYAVRIVDNATGELSFS